MQEHAIPQVHPVLAAVSRGYPGLGGSLITCYSPVRRFTRFRRNFHARLACLIHAANVRSEPGSNPSLRSSDRDSARDSSTTNAPLREPHPQARRLTIPFSWSPKPLHQPRHRHSPAGTGTRQRRSGKGLGRFCSHAVSRLSRMSKSRSHRTFQRATRAREGGRDRGSSRTRAQEGSGHTPPAQASRVKNRSEPPRPHRASPRDPRRRPRGGRSSAPRPAAGALRLAAGAGGLGNGPVSGWRGSRFRRRAARP